MTLIHLNLSYPQLAKMLQTEVNKQDITLRGHLIKIDGLKIFYKDERIHIKGDIHSTWDASFSFSSQPFFDSDTNKIILDKIELDLDAKNLIFKGILKLAKGNLKNRIEKALATPIDHYLLILRKKIDEEIVKAPLPHSLALQSKTSDIKIKTIDAGPDAINIKSQIDINLEVKFDGYN